jgi:hypothetical protein
MKPESLQQVAQMLRSDHHHHLGITAQPPKPAHAPAAARLEHPDIQSFTNALDRATTIQPILFPPDFSNSWIPRCYCDFRWAIPKTRATR